jgi:hypothetical protein
VADETSFADFLARIRAGSAGWDGRREPLARTIGRIAPRIGLDGDDDD